MRKILFLTLFFVAGFAQSNISIKSFDCYNVNLRKENILPVVNYRDSINSSRIAFEFDIESEQKPKLEIRFELCDAYGTPYLNSYFMNRLKNYDYCDIEAASSDNYGADYHSYNEFPNEYVSFPFPGKWKYSLVNSRNNQVYKTGFIHVVRNPLPAKADFSIDQIDGPLNDNNLLNKTLRLNGYLTLPEDFDILRISKVEIIENKKISTPYFIKNNEYSNVKTTSNRLPSTFEFSDRTIQPGNEYRLLDVSSDFYNYEEYRNYLNNPDLSRIYTRGVKTNPYLKKQTSSAGNYIKVKLALKCDEMYDKQIYITGDFNQWEVSPAYMMKKIGENYEINLEVLKGKHHYQYVVYNPELKTYNWLELEGNFLETQNTYNIFIYYSSPDEYGYDKLIGHTKLESRTYEN